MLRILRNRCVNAEKVFHRCAKRLCVAKTPKHHLIVATLISSVAKTQNIFTTYATRRIIYSQNQKRFRRKYK
ncbi:hypothetical protein [Ruminococcus sp.]|uniref:hypothetical protein n=1 Tax=uncultured Ruminococcus sp. TaxID=165186 RepID=UPI00266581BA|nr:hypothetical protein [uncultured Ruminococcus sp.]